jgi:threonine dehydratase
LKQHVRRIALAPEDGIVRAMRLIWERLKIVVEPSGATAFASILADSSMFTDKRVGVVLSGGNLDLDRLPWQS